MSGRKQPTQPPTNQRKPDPPPAPPRKDALVTRQCFSGVHTECHRIETCHCECHQAAQQISQVRRRYLSDAGFHYQVDRIAHETAADRYLKMHPDETHHTLALRTAIEALLRWVENQEDTADRILGRMGK